MKVRDGLLMAYLIPLVLLFSSYLTVHHPFYPLAVLNYFKFLPSHKNNYSSLLLPVGL